MFVFPRRARPLDLAMLVVVSLAVSAPTLRSIAQGPCVAMAGPTDFLSIPLPVAELHESVRSHGSVPLWRTSELYGVATAGDPSLRLLYPPMVIFVLWEMPLAEHLYVLFHTLLLAWGMYALIRGERCSPLAALAGAIMIGLSFKVATYRLCGWDTIFGAVAYVPLALHLFQRSMRSKGLAPGALLGVVLALSCLAGTPQIVVSLGLGLPAASLLALGKRRTRGRVARLARTLALGFGLAFLLAAPALLGSLEMSAASDRVGSYGSTLGPNVFEALTVPNLTRENLSWETLNYLGILALPLAGAGIASARRKLSFPLVVLVVFLVLAAGSATPIGRALELVPVVGKLSYVTRLLWIVAMAEALLAARGVDALMADGGRRRRAVAIGLAAGSLAAIVAFTIPGQYAKHLAAEEILTPLARGLRAAGLAVLLLAPLLAFVPKPRRVALLAVLVVATGVELLLLTESVMVRVPWEPFARPSLAERTLAAEPFARVMPVSGTSGRHDLVVPYQARVSRADGYNPLHSRAAAAYVHAIGGRSDEPWTPYVWIDRVARLDLLRVGASHVASRVPLEGLEVVASADESLWLPAGYETQGLVVLQRVPGALPRAYVMPRARSVASSEQLGRMIATNPFDGSRTLLVDGPVPAELEGESDAPLPVTIVSYEANAVTLEATVPAPGGFLVLLDADGAGWRATVDGVPAPIQRANALFRSVKLTGGTHSVAFRIGWTRPALVGFALAATGAVLALVLLVKKRQPIALR